MRRPMTANDIMPPVRVGQRAELPFMEAPDWRWNVVQDMNQDPTFGTYVPKRSDDQLLVAFLYPFSHDFIIHSTTNAGRRFLLHKYDGLAWAAQVHKENQALRWQIEAYLMSGLSLPQISARLGFPERELWWYSQCFFDVLDRLDDKDWVFRSVLQPAIHSPHNEMNYLWKTLAWKHAFGPAFLPQMNQVLGKFSKEVTAQLFDGIEKKNVIDALTSCARRTPNRYNEELILEQHSQACERRMEEKRAGQAESQTDYIKTVLNTIGESLRLAPKMDTLGPVEQRADMELAEAFNKRRKEMREDAEAKMQAKVAEQQDVK